VPDELGEESSDGQGQKWTLIMGRRGTKNANPKKGRTWPGIKQTSRVKPRNKGWGAKGQVLSFRVRKRKARCIHESGTGKPCGGSKNAERMPTF